MERTKDPRTSLHMKSNCEWRPDPGRRSANIEQTTAKEGVARQRIWILDVSDQHPQSGSIYDEFHRTRVFTGWWSPH